jgi:glutamine synthetase
VTPGRLTLDDLGARVERGEIDTVVVAFADHYGRLMGKRFDAEFFLAETASAGTHGCDYLLASDMEMEPVPGYAFANWQLGYGDVHLIPDLTTLRIADWLDGSAIVLCDLERDHQPVVPSPRAILKAQLARAAEMGFEVMAASELEYYLFDGSYRQAAAEGYSAQVPAGWYLEDYHILQGSRTEAFTRAARLHLKRSGIPVESSKGEWGLGQHEINLRYADVLTTADRHLLFKQCLKELADRQGRSVTFMAKPFTDRAGSSCHLHLSLWRGSANAFANGDAPSDTFRAFLAGWMEHAPAFMPLYAPTVNSYKRYRDGSWAPTRLAWSVDNRTAGFRVVGAGASLRIECRIPGADVHPYLAFAAALASGLDGLERGAEPPSRFDGDAYQASELPQLPGSLREATERFAASRVVRRALGAAVVDHYRHFFEVEQAAFDSAVTDWERRRYFERI